MWKWMSVARWVFVGLFLAVLCLFLISGWALDQVALDRDVEALINMVSVAVFFFLGLPCAILGATLAAVLRFRRLIVQLKGNR